MMTRKHELWTLLIWVITVSSGVFAQGVPQAPGNTVQVCYNNQLSFVDTGLGDLNYPQTTTDPKVCTCTAALSGVSENATATLRVQLTGTRSEDPVCRSKLQVFTPQKVYRLLCSYPVNSSFDLPIDDYGERMLFSQDAGALQFKFSLVEGSGTVLISCSGDPLPSVTPRVPTPPTLRPTPSTAPTTPTTARQTSPAPPPTTRPTQQTQSTKPPSTMTSRSTTSLAQKSPLTTRSPSPPTQQRPSTTAPQPTIRPTPATTQPTRPAARSTPSTARQTAAISRRTPSPTHDQKTTSGMHTTRKPSCPVHQDTPAELLFKSYTEEFFFRAFMKCTCRKLRREYELLNKPVFSMDQEESRRRQPQTNKGSLMTMLWFARKD